MVSPRVVSKLPGSTVYEAAYLLTSQAQGVGELHDLEGRWILVHCLHVEYGTSDPPGLLDQLVELGPGQDGITHQNFL